MVAREGLNCIILAEKIIVKKVGVYNSMGLNHVQLTFRLGVDLRNNEIKISSTLIGLFFRFGNLLKDCLPIALGQIFLFCCFVNPTNDYESTFSSQFCCVQKS